jgi:hypothetical protein
LWWKGTGPAITVAKQAASSANVEKTTILKMIIEIKEAKNEDDTEKLLRRALGRNNERSDRQKRRDWEL